MPSSDFKIYKGLLLFAVEAKRFAINRTIIKTFICKTENIRSGIGVSGIGLKPR